MRLSWSVVKRASAGVALALLAVAVPAQSGAADPGHRTDFAGYPSAEWRRGDPARAGFDPAVLEEIAADAQAHGSNCLAVVRHGRLVAEWYWNGTGAASSQEVFSVTKSVTSTLLGIAEADRELDTDDPAADYLPAWAGTPAAAVTVEDLLSNDSGRHWDVQTDYGGLVGARDRTGFAAALPQGAAPGEIWAYNNAAIQTLDDVLSGATREEPADYAERELFEPLGMERTDMTRDAAGNTNMFFGMHSTCQDLARFGYLFLRDGRWERERIVPTRWVRQATGRSSQDLNAAYGRLWWLNHRGPITDPLTPITREQAEQAPDEQLVPGAPKRMYWALGLGGQVVQVDPGTDTVVVRLGPGDLRSTYGPANTARVVTEALVRH